MAVIDEQEIRKFLTHVKSDGELIEVRGISGARNFSGYFTSIDTMIAELKKQDLKGFNVYFVLNKINDACYGRKQHDCFITGKGRDLVTTSDNDIVGREWILVDLDPKRPSGTSSSDEELKCALNKMRDIYNYLQQIGFSAPVMCSSGNGYHMLYKVHLANNDSTKDVIKKFLATLSMLFSDDHVEVDTANFNAARICKVAGTMSSKGSNTKARPWRVAKMVYCPRALKTTDIAYIRKVNGEIPEEPEKPQKYNHYSPRTFDLDEWLNRYSIGYRKEENRDYTKYILDHCPFDENHKGKDAVLIRLPSGAISFHCFHNSCQGHTWHDMRLLFEPDAYERRAMEAEKRMYSHYNREEKVKTLEPKEGEPIWITADDVVGRPREPEHFIKTGIVEYDTRFRGLKKGNVTLLSGYTGGAKSTLLSEIMLNAVNGGFRVACFSGELSDEDFYRWMFLQAAGKSHVEATQYENYFNVPAQVQKKIADWMNGKFWLYNNKYGMNYAAIINEIRKQITEKQLDMVCIDNLMALDISDLSVKELEAQGKFAWDLHMTAMTMGVHIIVVCHPRKSNGLLGRYDVAGSGNIVNSFDNILFVYRVDQEFKNYYKDFYRDEFGGEGTNCVHCAKARFGSIDDTYSDLFYEPETKRLKNELTENVIYGWDDDPMAGFEPVEETEVFT